MNTLTVVIPSKTQENAEACYIAVRQNEPEAEVLIIDDGLYRRWEAPGLRFITGPKPFIFARNCNLGMAYAKGDVVLCNDDALLESPGGFTKMQRFAATRPEVGIVSASTDLAGNPEQNRRAAAGFRILERPTPGNSFATVAFVCVLIPRRTIETVGYLDERFTAYGWEDNDYCRRAARNILKVAVADCCYVNHGRLKSTFRGDPKAPAAIDAGRAIYLNKWGRM